ncbi:MAG TPA: cytochrome c oxidase subunit 3 family protein [Geobacteraceae bacterium]|nr:cytochrome c oxidase subunit 3 family protein [Geobacteraceae bacterium]
MTEEHPQHGESPEAVFETAKLGLWTFLATEILLFGGLFTSYIVYRLRYPDLFHAQYQYLNRTLGLVNTVILITSSLTMALAIAAIRRGRQWVSRLCLVLTIMFALGFLGVKYVEWTEDFSRGLYPGTNMFFSLYFMMTGLHGLHVVAGICVLSAVLVMSCRGRFSEQYATPVEISGLYWHFVDLVWIYLFPLLYLVG